MRGMLLVLLAAGLAGCLVDDAGTDDAGGLAAQTARCRPAERDGVVLATGPYSAAPTQQGAIDVNVPPCATLVRFEISVAPLAVSTSGGEVAMTGCGAKSFTWTQTVGIGGNAASGDLCDAAEAGMQTLTVAATLLPMAGTVTVRADLPR